MNNIIESIGINKSIKFIIHINNNCNFSCHYCAAGLNKGNNLRKGDLSIDNFNKIIDIIKKLKNIDKFKNVKFDIDITGGEPTINKNFSYILNKLNDIKDICDLQITTNGKLLYKFSNEILSFSDKNISFNISCHYFEYLSNIDSLLKSIKMLKENGINFFLKFLLPDKNVKLKSFLEFKDFLLKSFDFFGVDISYSLIILHKTGKISDTYHNSILEYYNNSNNNLLNKKILNRENNLINIKYKSGDEKKYGFGELMNNGLNNFKGYKCYYINSTNTSFQILFDGTVKMGGCCDTLTYLRYNIDDIETLLLGKDKYIICRENRCTMDLCLGLKKSLIKKGDVDFLTGNKMKLFLFDKVKKGIVSDIVLENLMVNKRNSIVLSIIYNDLEIDVFISKENIKKYFSYEIKGLFYHLILKNEINITNDKINYLIKNIIYFDILFRKIL